MDYKKLSRPLTADEIEFKVQTVGTSGKGKGYALLAAYQSARTPMKILDEVVGPMNWSLSYPLYLPPVKVERADGKIEYSDPMAMARIGVKDGDSWIYKESNGTGEGNDKEKAAYSDALKRAAVLFGIGRGLYDFPKLFIELNDEEIKDGRATNKLRPQDWDWSVEYDDKGHIKTLKATQIVKGANPRTSIRYSYEAK